MSRIPLVAALLFAVACTTPVCPDKPEAEIQLRDLFVEVVLYKGPSPHYTLTCKLEESGGVGAEITAVKTRHIDFGGAEVSGKTHDPGEVFQTYWLDARTTVVGRAEFFDADYGRVEKMKLEVNWTDENGNTGRADAQADVVLTMPVRK